MAIPDKAGLRKEFLTKRNALDADARARMSSLIRQRVFQSPAWRKSSTILCYVSFGSEVETHTLIQEALRFKKRVIVPLHDPTKETLLSELHRFSELGPNHRGVLQVKPELRKLVDPKEVELALIPGIVFDRQGGRIGFGGGYFDRLLPKMPQATRMALAFDAQIVQNPLPLEAHDVLVDTLVTDTGTLEIRTTVKRLNG
jgi:5-formyltetrahydrofolate cyclo-ligase